MKGRPLHTLALAFLLAFSLPAAVVGAQAQTAAQTSDSSLPDGPISRDTAAKLMPQTVFFASKTAPIQGRNTGGAKLPHGLMLAGLVDTSGYSSGVQERYQAYLLLDTPAVFAGKRLGPGAYGCAVVGSDFLVEDLGANELFHVPAQHDAQLPHPTPLQVVKDTSQGAYRLYFGRNYVTFAPPTTP